MKRSWGIIGLGWLGEALAAELRRLGYPTWGTHRAQFQFAVNPFPTTACDVLFLNTPPLLKLTPAQYVSEIKATEKMHIIFVSSTSVYGNLAGRVTESTPPRPESESARWLLDVENALHTCFKNQLTVIRPGGLIGGTRHPVQHLSGRQGVANPKQPINLIHRDDLIGIILAAAEASVPLINAVAPYHPSREEYYSDWARKLNLPSIQFSLENSPGKSVDSDVLNSIYSEWKIPRLNSI